VALYNFKRWDNGQLLTQVQADNDARAVAKAVANGTDMSFADLRGLDLTNANLAGGTFKNAKLDVCVVDNTNLRGADLTNVGMHGVIRKVNDNTSEQYNKMHLQGATTTNLDFSPRGTHEFPSFESAAFKSWWNGLTSAQQTYFKGLFAEGLN
jgi:uncharacterized protein YjbI with pentapeptide repeats